MLDRNGFAVQEPDEALQVRLQMSGSEQAANAARAASRQPQKPSLISIALQLKRVFAMNSTITAKSAWASKINWTQAAGLAATAAAYFGLPVTAPEMVGIFGAVQTVVAVTTWAFRTFGNNSVSADMAGKTVTIK